MFTFNSSVFTLMHVQLIKLMKTAFPNSPKVVKDTTFHSKFPFNDSETL